MCGFKATIVGMGAPMPGKAADGSRARIRAAAGSRTATCAAMAAGSLSKDTGAKIRPIGAADNLESMTYTNTTSSVERMPTDGSLGDRSKTCVSNGKSCVIRRQPNAGRHRQVLDL
jgi:hypothetical protein